MSSSRHSVYWKGDVELMRPKMTFRGHSPSISVPRTELCDLLQIDLLGDGFRVHSSRRERVDMFRTTDAPVAAATIQWLLAHEGPA